jgi:hypothetical protein
MEQLSGLDAAFVYAETAGAAHVTFFAIYDPSSARGWSPSARPPGSRGGNLITAMSLRFDARRQ